MKNLAIVLGLCAFIATPVMADDHAAAPAAPAAHTEEAPADAHADAKHTGKKAKGKKMAKGKMAKKSKSEETTSDEHKSE